MIEVKDLSCSYKENRDQFLFGADIEKEELYQNNILKNLSFSIRPGNVYGVIGRNGAGKTTLLNCICGVIRPIGLKNQRVFIDGQPLNGDNPKMLASIFMVTDVIPDIHVKTGKYAVMLSCMYPHFSMEQFQDNMKLFQMDTDRFIDSLSLGQKKMVFLSLAFASGAPYIVMDEPTNGLDITSRKVFRKLVASNMADDRAIIISTHHINEVCSLLDHIFILDNKRMVFDHPVMEIGSTLSFVESDNESDTNGALYTLSSAYGKRMILPNTTGTDSEIDYELLFEAVLENPVLINSLFTSHI